MRVVNDEWRVAMKSDIGLSGNAHKIQARSGDNKTCLLRCGVVWCGD